MIQHRKYLEKARTRHGRTIYYFRRDRRIRLPDDYGTTAFWSAYEAALSGKSLPPRTRLPTADGILRGRIGKTVERILLASRRRAKASGRPYDLSYDWAISQIEAQEFRCALTGIQFYSRFDGACRVHPYGPSFDKIDTRGGYVRSNIRIVCYAVNVMLMDWGEPVFRTVANHYRAITRSR